MGVEAALGVGYGLVALLAMIPTWLEQGASGVEGAARRLPGLAACLLWPLALAVVAALAWRAAGRTEEALALAPRGSLRRT